jgi:DNA-binding transcriptional ArsR family regulator/predicted transcriptional regulator
MEDQFRQIASLIGDPARASIMWALLDGKAFTATELALIAETTPQNVSMHLSKLVQADLLSVESQGRHRYFKYARKEVAYAIEAMAGLVPPHASKKPMQAEEAGVRHCRTCYDHMAGRVGVAITDSLLKQNIIAGKKGGFDLTAKGEKWFVAFGIDTASLREKRRSFLRPCLDWSERRHHMAGSLATAFLEMMLADDWVRRTKNSRALIVTGKGRKKLQQFGNLAI